MAVNQPPMFLEGGCYAAEDFRGLVAAAAGDREGITRGMLVTVSGRDVTVAPGEAVVAGEETGTGSYMIKLRTATTVTVAPGAASGGSRIDLIVAKVEAISAGDVQDIAAIEVVQGTTGAGAPALPARTALVATVTIPQNATTLTASNLVSAPNASYLGRAPHFASTAERTAAIPNPVAGQLATTAGVLAQYDTTRAAWVNLLHGGVEFRGELQAHQGFSQEGTFEKVGFDSILTDVGSRWSAAQRSWLAPRAGVVEVLATATVQTSGGNATGIRASIFQGTTDYRFAQIAGPSVNTWSQTGSRWLTVTAGQAISLQVAKDAPGIVTTIFGSGFTSMACRYIG